MHVRQILIVAVAISCGKSHDSDREVWRQCGEGRVSVCETLCNSGHGFGCFKAGVTLEGESVEGPPDKERARRLYERACSLGVPTDIGDMTDDACCGAAIASACSQTRPRLDYAKHYAEKACQLDPKITCCWLLDNGLAQGVIPKSTCGSLAQDHSDAGNTH